MAAKPDYSVSPPDRIAADLGEALARLRLAQDISQASLAGRAGLSERTLRRLENGEGCTLDSLIRVMQALGMAEHLAALLPDPGMRPADRLARGVREPQRASRGRRRRQEGDEGWSWDEEQTP